MAQRCLLRRHQPDTKQQNQVPGVSIYADPQGPPCETSLGKRNLQDTRGNSRLLDSPPPPSLDGWIMLNTDGAAKGNPGPAVGGGIFRGTRGEWLYGFAENMGCCTSVKAELKAVFQGLRIACDRGIKKLWVQSNSIVTMGILKDNMVTNSEHAILAGLCKRLISLQDWEVLISHYFRETNKVVDVLDNLGTQLVVSFQFFNSPPKEAMVVLFSDSVRVNWPHLVNR